jgi:hypothetical protein
MGNRQSPVGIAHCMVQLAWPHPYPNARAVLAVDVYAHDQRIRVEEKGDAILPREREPRFELVAANFTDQICPAGEYDGRCGEDRVS